MKYPCTSCGACCRRFAPVEFRRPDGVCQHYDDATRQCSIYETRPPLCSYDKTYESFLKPRVGLRAYWLASAKVCAVLDPQANADLPAKVEAQLRDSGGDHGPADTDGDPALMMELLTDVYAVDEYRIGIMPAAQSKM